MSHGGVFHPGHDELHGQTVVLFTNGPRTIIGRWDQEMGEMIRIVDAALHEEEPNGPARDAFVAQSKKFGVAVAFPVLTVPKKEVTRVVKLREA